MSKRDIGISAQADFAQQMLSRASGGRSQNPESKECGLHVKSA